MLKTSIILITLSAISKGFCDSIKFHPGTFPFQGDWWLGKGEYLWSNRTWLETNVLSFVSDGWHLFDAVRIAALLLIVALLLVRLWKPVKDRPFDCAQGDRFYIDHNRWVAAAGLLVLLFIYHGIIFTLTFWIL
jgi:hypothetical protein